MFKEHGYITLHDKGSFDGVAEEKEIKKNKKDVVILNFTQKRTKAGFTLIEILVVIGLLAVLATVVLVAINPARQFKSARDTQRKANVAAIINAIGHNISDNGGIFMCNGQNTQIPTDTALIKSGEGGFDVASCVVPTYISSLPFDPSTENSFYDSNQNYSTNYSIIQDQLGRITVSANGELPENQSISITR